MRSSGRFGGLTVDVMGGCYASLTLICLRPRTPPAVTATFLCFACLERWPMALQLRPA
jgi:hypothetical protein